MKAKSVLCAMAIALSLFGGEKKVLALAGSTRDESLNKKLVQEASIIARKMGAQVTFLDLKDYPMPFYDEDLEKKQGMPANAKHVRDLMIASDLILISTPEYNASIPAVLKNTIDWASRSEEGGYSPDAFKEKKFAIMSASPGSGGGSRSLSHLRVILEAVGGHVSPFQVSVPRAHNAFNEENRLTEKSVQQELQKAISSALE